MSYILDALKKSDQERQQGTTPHLYSVHSSAPPGPNFPSLRLRRGLWLLFGIALVLFICLGIFLFLNLRSVPPPHSTVLDTERSTSQEQPAEQAVSKGGSQDPQQVSTQIADKNGATMPQVIIKENNIVLRSVALKEKTSPPSRIVTKEDTLPSLPQLKDLSAAMRAEVPELKFAGHTYSEDSAQRMIIINGQILREGETITTGTRLSEITWDGVVIDFEGTRFLVKIH